FFLAVVQLTLPQKQRRALLCQSRYQDKYD
ncbi:MAG: hypothetical protein ACI825_000554, partial [Planctomycetota bacterium]